MTLWGANSGHGEQLVDNQCCEGAVMFAKMFGEMSRIFWHFVRHDGNVGCEETGRRMFGKGLKMGGGDK